MSKAIDPQEVDKAMEEVRTAISQFVHFALDENKNETEREEEGSAKIESTWQSLKFVTDLLGLDTQNFLKDPQLLQQSLLQFMSGFGNIANIFDEESLRSPEGLAQSVDKLSAEFSGQGIDFQELADELPEELKAELEGGNSEEIAQQMHTRALGFTQALQGLLRDKELDHEQLFTGLEKLAADFSFREIAEDEPVDIGNSVKERLEKRLDKSLSKLDLDFSYDAIFGKKPEGPESE